MQFNNKLEFSYCRFNSFYGTKTIIAEFVDCQY